MTEGVNLSNETCHTTTFAKQTYRITADDTYYSAAVVPSVASVGASAGAVVGASVGGTTGSTTGGASVGGTTGSTTGALGSVP